MPLAPGGTLDFNLRMIGEFVSHSIGQQVIIENKPGAGGTAAQLASLVRADFEKYGRLTRELGIRSEWGQDEITK